MESPPSPTKIPKQTIQNAIISLLKYNSIKSQSQKPQLFSCDDFLYLVLSLQKIPQKPRTNAFKIPLPNPLYDPKNTEICLIIDDKKLDSKTAKEKILNEKIPVSKVLKYGKLKSDYKAFESKRKLCDSYELFFGDKRVIEVLGRVIGRCFYRKKKIPVPIELGRKNGSGWKEEIERVCGCALMYLGSGSCVVVKVAKAEFGVQGMVDNVVAAVDGVVGFVPKGWDNVRSIHLKWAGSLALPIYQALPRLRMRIEFDHNVDNNVEEIEAGGTEAGTGTGSEKKGSNVGRKRGRIHEVRYMDSVSFGEDDSGSDEDEKVMGSEVEENGEMGCGEILGKKRNKGLKLKKGKVLGDNEARDEGEMGSGKVVEKSRNKGVKKVAKVKKGKFIGKSMFEKKSKKSKVAV